MKWWKEVLLVIVLIFILLGLASIVPGGEHIARAMYNVLRIGVNSIVLFALLAIVFLGPGFIGAIVRGIGVQTLDDVQDEEKRISIITHWAIAIVAGAIYGLVQIVGLVWILDLGTWLTPVFREFEIGGPFETPPYIWGIYGMIVFMIGYAAASSSD